MSEVHASKAKKKFVTKSCEQVSMLMLHPDGKRFNMNNYVY